MFRFIRLRYKFRGDRKREAPENDSDKDWREAKEENERGADVVYWFHGRKSDKTGHEAQAVHNKKNGEESYNQTNYLFFVHNVSRFVF